jgi:hypothetical protein
MALRGGEDAVMMPAAKRIAVKAKAARARLEGSSVVGATPKRALLTSSSFAAVPSRLMRMVRSSRPAARAARRPSP